MSNGTKNVHVAVYDTLADWEVGHAIAHIANGSFRAEPNEFAVVAVGATREPVTTMGGLRVLPDIALDELDPADSAMLILPGAATWDAGGNSEFTEAARRFVEAGVPVAAICGATFGLAAAGLLDDRDHTSSAAEYLAASGYKGGDRYVEADAVNGGGVITAGTTAQTGLAREIFAELGLYTPEVLDAWFRLFQHSDPSAFPVLMAASGAGR
ncbi:DJ-1/PfpI family protein [Actinomadura rupiterrae]|uniref:DJ-1/PfpI family protein n=1 Tax=Actinomadura rupiterrae TaxID=559627 RepID=UPI0020A5CB4C|nr:DJ-1/PfpI family protein [Actinomadura rupiterrae]MCP2342673.1 putative intracellular protease/amidase [Actinomadura rupiterrae]